MCRELGRLLRVANLLRLAAHTHLDRITAPPEVKHHSVNGQNPRHAYHNNFWSQTNSKQVSMCIMGRTRTLRYILSLLAPCCNPAGHLWRHRPSCRMFTTNDIGPILATTCLSLLLRSSSRLVRRGRASALVDMNRPIDHDIHTLTITCRSMSSKSGMALNMLDNHIVIGFHVVIVRIYIVVKARDGVLDYGVSYGACYSYVMNAGYAQCAQ